MTWIGVLFGALLVALWIAFDYFFVHRPYADDERNDRLNEHLLYQEAPPREFEKHGG